VHKGLKFIIQFETSPNNIPILHLISKLLFKFIEDLGIRNGCSLFPSSFSVVFSLR